MGSLRVRGHPAHGDQGQLGDRGGTPGRGLARGSLEATLPQALLSVCQHCLPASGWGGFSAEAQPQASASPSKGEDCHTSHGGLAQEHSVQALPIESSTLLPGGALVMLVVTAAALVAAPHGGTEGQASEHQTGT